MDGAILSLVFALVCGRSIYSHIEKGTLDIWDYEPGVRLFKFMYSEELGAILSERRGSYEI